MRTALLGILIGVAIAPSGARAQRAAVALEYEAPADARCPDAQGFEARVGSRLGYLPFDPAAHDTARVSVTREGEELVGALSTEIDGAQTARQTRTPASECAALVDALAWLLALAIDPDALAASGPEEAPDEAANDDAFDDPFPSTPPDPAPAAPPEPRPSVGPPAGARGSWGRPVVASRLPIVEPRRAPFESPAGAPYGFLQLAAGVGVLGLPGDVGPVGAIAGGVVFDETYELRFDLSWTAAQGRETEAGLVEAMAFDVRASVCAVHVGVVGGCLVVGVGALPAWAQGGAAALAPRVTISARGIVRWEWTEDVGIALELEAGPMLVRPELAVDGALAWTAPEAFFEALVPLYVRLR